MQLCHSHRCKRNGQGRARDVYPEDTARAGPGAIETELSNSLLAPTGKEEFDETSVGAIFAKEPPKTSARRIDLSNHMFLIPANDANHEVTDCHSFQKDGRAHEDCRLLIWLDGAGFGDLARYDSGQSAVHVELRCQVRGGGNFSGLLATAFADASKQVVFSGTGVYNYGSANPADKHFGFWIWCEGESTNPYAGICNGAMYFYGLAITTHVAGGVSEVSEGVYRMTVASTANDSIQNCILTNASPVVSGPHNTVTVTCTAPSGSGSSPTAVVNVTGPSN